MKTKKAQGLSLNMIVIGAIALVVLVVVITIFISGARSTRPKDVKSCAEANGFSEASAVPNGVHFIISPTQCASIGGSPILGKFSDVTAPMVCCNKGACDKTKELKWTYGSTYFDNKEEAEILAAQQGNRITVQQEMVCVTGREINGPKYQADCCI